MQINWCRRTADFVKARLEALLAAAATGSRGEEREIARKMQALPVYMDMGGALAFTIDGVVLSLDWETEQVGPETDESWIVVAAVAAAEKYPELCELLPPMPPHATICQSCRGTGKLLLTPESTFRCGTCWGLGWVETA